MSLEKFANMLNVDTFVWIGRIFMETNDCENLKKRILNNRKKDYKFRKNEYKMIRNAIIPVIRQYKEKLTNESIDDIAYWLSYVLNETINKELA